MSAEGRPPPTPNPLLDALEALRRSERHLREAQQIAGVASWHWDAQTRERSWSTELCRLYGVPPGETPSVEEAMQLIHEDDHGPAPGTWRSRDARSPGRARCTGSSARTPSTSSPRPGRSPSGSSRRTEGQSTSWSWARGAAGGALIADRILAQLASPIELDGAPVQLTASIGICVSPVEGANRDALLHTADSAMYKAKAAGRGRYVIAEE